MDILVKWYQAVTDTIGQRSTDVASGALGTVVVMLVWKLFSWLVN